jgi:hypothetical protein
MKADDAVIEALNLIYPLVLTLKEQTHRQENVFRSAHYHKLSKKFNRLTNFIHKGPLHELVRWFSSHHADPDSRLLEVRVAEPNEPTDAYTYTDDILKAINQALLAACVAVHDADDYVTGKLIHCLLKEVESWRDRFDAELDQVADLGTKLYLQKMK